MAHVKSGRIWERPPRRRAQAVRRVCEALGKVYGRPRLGNPEDAVEDLVYIILSNKTAPSTAGRVYRKLKGEFKRWEEVDERTLEKVRRLIGPAGLSGVKSGQLSKALVAIKEDFGQCSLEALRTLTADDAESYLRSLSGVSEKVAKCVMMYTLGFSVLPVDSHVHRISRRLGWTERGRADQCHWELEEIVKPEYRYVFHVGCIVHGRTVCRPQNPLCERCVLRRYCMYYEERASGHR